MADARNDLRRRLRKLGGPTSTQEAQPSRASLLPTAGPGTTAERHSWTRWLFQPPSGLAFLSAGGALALSLAEARGHQVDFDIYRMGAVNIAGQHLYDVRLSRSLMGGSRGMHFNYPPFAALLFWPFALLPVSVGQIVWSVLNLLALAAIVAVSVRALRPDWPPRRAWAAAAIALFPALRLNPDSLTMSYGQVNFLVVLLALADLTSPAWLRSRLIPRGVLLGISSAIKLTPLIFIPFLFLTRQIRAAITALAAFLACTLGAFAVAPRSSWIYWTTEIFDTRHAGNLLYTSDQNLHSALQRLTEGTPPAAELASLTVLLAAAGLAIAARAYRASSPTLGILACAATGLIISPVSWAHHYVWVVPALAWLALGHDRPAGGRWWALAAATLFWVAPIWWVSDPQSGYGGLFTLLAGNSFFLAAVAMVVAACALPWARRAPDA